MLNIILHDSFSFWMTESSHQKMCHIQVFVNDGRATSAPSLNTLIFSLTAGRFSSLTHSQCPCFPVLCSSASRSHHWGPSLHPVLSCEDIQLLKTFIFPRQQAPFVSATFATPSGDYTASQGGDLLMEQKFLKGHCMWEQDSHLVPGLQMAGERGAQAGVTRVFLARYSSRSIHFCPPGTGHWVSWTFEPEQWLSCVPGDAHPTGCHIYGFLGTGELR